MRKRLLAIIATAAMVVAMVPSMVFADTAWDGTTVDTSWYDPSKTVFELSDAADLAGLAKLVNAGTENFSGKTIKLTKSIDLNNKAWTPIGNTTYDTDTKNSIKDYTPLDDKKVFSGTFDGNGKVISNLKIEKMIDNNPDAEGNVGLFSITGEGATIKNLTITNVTINASGRNVGALAGYAYNAKMSNITVNGKINISGGNNVSGVFGMSRHHDASAVNITVSGAAGSVISGNNIVGGITAEIAPNGAEQTFSNLKVENVEIKGIGGVGGVVGLLTNGSMSNVSVKNVALTGNTKSGDDPMGRIRLGGVVGLLGGKGPSAVSNATVENVTGRNLDGSTVTLPVVGANYDASSNATEAKIGDNYYATVQAALSKAKQGDTVEILAKPVDDLTDVTIPEGVIIKNKTDQTINVGGEELAPYVEPSTPATPSKPVDSPNTGDNSMAPIAVAGLALAAMAAVVATRRRTN